MFFLTFPFVKVFLCAVSNAVCFLLADFYEFAVSSCYVYAALAVCCFLSAYGIGGVVGSLRIVCNAVYG